MKCTYACNSPDHVLSRRRFLGGVGRLAGPGLGSAGFSGFTAPAVAAELARKQRQVLVIWLAGGASQLETWDPKPKTDTGGPFRSIETSVPGVRISELLPKTAMQMHRLALVRSINTNENDHGKGHYLMHTGRPQTPAADYPHLGSVDGEVAARTRRTRCPATSTSRPAAAARGRARRRSSGPSTTRSTSATASAPANTAPTRPLSAPGASGRQALRHAPERPLRPPPPDRRDRGVYHHVRAGPQADDPPRGLRRLQGAGPATWTATAPTTSAATACWPAACSKSGATFVQVTPLELRHPQRELRLPPRAGRRVRPVVRHPDRRPGRPRAARAHARRRHVGVRPHAADQLPLRPRPLGHRLVGLPGRRGDQAGQRRRQDQRQAAPRSSTSRSAAATCSTPTCAPWGSTRPNRSRPTAA